MKKRLIFEASEGCTNCSQCPFYSVGDDLDDVCGNPDMIIDCCKYDLSTFRFVEEEEGII